MFRRIVLCVALFSLCITGLVAQDDEESWITYIVASHIYRMRADGTDPHLLTDVIATTMRWSSDGEWILIATIEGLPEGTDTTSYSHLFRIDTDGTNLQQITPEPVFLLRHLELSPDDEWIVYTACPDGYMHDCQLYKVRSDGTDFAHVDASPGYNQYLSWSPDSETFLFSAYDGQRRNIYRMNPEESEAELLTEGGSMAWSPDGEWIAYMGNDGLYRMRPDGSESEALRRDMGLTEMLRWSPDSEWIVFASREDNIIHLYRMRSDGSQQERITHSGGTDADWSPDGEWIVFRARDVDNYNLYRMRPDGTDLQQLTDTPSDERIPLWQPLHPDE